MASYVGLKARSLGFDAHLTLCYFGKDNPEEEIIRLLVNEVNSPPVRLRVLRTGIDLFGPKNTIPVIRVEPVSEPSLLLDLRELFEKFSVSEFPHWNPHITIDFDAYEIRIPLEITLTDLGVY